MKDIFRIIRPALLVAALICAVIATLIGFEVIDVTHGKAVILTSAWGFWSVACYVGSKISAELAA